MTQKMTPDEYFRFASQPNDEDPATEFAAWPTFPFAGPLTTKALTSPELPEPPRRGEKGKECSDCGGGASSQLQMRGSLGILWADLGRALPQHILDANHRLVLTNFVARVGGELSG